MRSIFTLIAAAALTASLAGCYSPQDRAVGGAAIGGLTGAGIGALASGGRVGPTLAGGALGAATGAVVGAVTAPAPSGGCAAWDYDPYGRPYCRGYY